jgi:hypothetical protein
MGDLRQSDLDRINELAESVASLSARVDALWQVISAVVQSAGLPDPPPDFVRAVATARQTGRRGVRLSVDGREWVAALSEQAPEPDPASWSAIERLARSATDHDEM